MKLHIKNHLKLAKQSETVLYEDVCFLDNTMNDCSCDNRVKHDFRNIIPVEETSILCLNCGGYIEPNEEDWF
jgi:hypothetical protein